MALFYMKDNLCTSYKLEFHRLYQFLISNGWVEVASPQKADVLIAGVCGSFERDEERASRILRSLGDAKKPLYVIGCMVAISPQKMCQGRLFYSWEYERLANELIPYPLKSWGDVILPTLFRCREDYRLYSTNKAFVRVSTGCGFNCSYCPHKIGAGELCSEPIDTVISQIRGLRHRGTIILTGLDTASYGKDIGTSFGQLLDSIVGSNKEGVRYHIAQFNPQGLRYGDMAHCCANPVITDLQLPIQTTSVRLLKLMNRDYTMSEVAKFLDDVKTNSGLFLRTDIMVGFPTETDSEFADTIDFVSAHFQEVAMYRYEHKACTPIAKSGLPLCSTETIDRRMKLGMKRLRDAGVLVHSGGQDINSLLVADRRKETLNAE